MEHHIQAIFESSIKRKNIMPIIKTIHGDLVAAFMNPTNQEITDMAHGCNCTARMGAGIAKTVAEMMPGAFEKDKEVARINTFVNEVIKFIKGVHASTDVKPDRTEFALAMDMYYLAKFYACQSHAPISLNSRERQAGLKLDQWLSTINKDTE